MTYVMVQGLLLVQQKSLRYIVSYLGISWLGKCKAQRAARMRDCFLDG